jgi:hypothetical protein
MAAGCMAVSVCRSACMRSSVRMKLSAWRIVEAA